MHHVKDGMRAQKEETRGLRDEFRLAIDIHERLAAVEAKIGRYY